MFARREIGNKLPISAVAAIFITSSMNWTRAKGRRPLLVVGCLLIGIVCLVCAVHWDFEQLGLPAALMFSLGLLLTLPIYTCAACGRECIRFGKRKESWYRSPGGQSRKFPSTLCPFHEWQIGSCRGSCS